MARKPEGPLRRGWTTGACATAATKAAFTALLSGDFPDPVQITLPKGQQPCFALATERLEATKAEAGIVKDAGDDPDVTHRALIVSTVSLGRPGTGVVFEAGVGVGTVTLPGLPIAVGEPAINPVPRQMMTTVVSEVSRVYGAPNDVKVRISVADGELLAQKTWNPRLGIVGGLSILGTTGIVIPYSCSAWIHSIHRGIDVAVAGGFEHVAGCTGSTSEGAVQTLYGLADNAMLDMGDFAGGLLKYLRRHPVRKLTIGGGFGKLSKLAMGHMDLHSGRSQVDLHQLGEWLKTLGASAPLVAQAGTANTANHVLTMASEAGLPLADLVADEARHSALKMLRGKTEVEVIVFDRRGALAGRSKGF
jgi:cobalt-precorrin-5B (C1)-methyltransferase